MKPDKQKPAQLAVKIMPTRLKILLCALCLLAPIATIMWLTGTIGTSVLNSAAPTTGKEWYVGGSLRNGTVDDWRRGSYDDKLATCAKFIAKFKKDGQLNLSTLQKIRTTEGMRPLAEKLVKYIDRRCRHSNRGSDSKVFFIAFRGMLDMGWSK